MPTDVVGPCWAGRKAFFGGKWSTPCPGMGIHTILSAPGAPEISLCEEHFQQVNAAGLVSMPYVSTEETQARKIVNQALQRDDHPLVEHVRSRLNEHLPHLPDAEAWVVDDDMNLRCPADQTIVVPSPKWLGR